MIKQATILAGLALAAATLPFACFDAADAPTCTISCTQNADCPGGLSCGPEGVCAGAGEVCTTSCTPNEFINCADSSMLVRCNGTGDGIVQQECGAPACNAERGACNVCVPAGRACASSTTIELCMDDGSGMLPAITCNAGCVDEANGVSAHCGYISPIWMPDICDQLAMDPMLLVSSSMTLNTSADVICNGRIIPQTGGPEICVLRYGLIGIVAGNTLKVQGNRALALVTDGPLTINGNLDVSADGLASGPGGGFLVSGARVSGVNGGGGAGFGTAGGNGGTGVGGTPGVGGAAFDPLASANPTPISGGARPLGPIVQDMNPVRPGTGGGAVLLVSCRGTVQVNGTIDAGGSGGEGGKDASFIANDTNIKGGGGGGAGGYVVVQGTAVEITGTAGIYANGGAGGGSCSTDNCTATKGDDGAASTTAAGGGPGANGGGAGGVGGVGNSPPGNGASSNAGAGGGGAVGRIQIFTPSGVAPVIDSGTTRSPPLETHRNVPIR